MSEETDLETVVARGIADQRKTDEVAAGFPSYANQDSILPMDRRAARAALSAISAAGHRVVPVEPTEEMLAAADSAIPRAEADDAGQRMMGREVALEAWRAMLSAAAKVSAL